MKETLDVLSVSLGSHRRDCQLEDTFGGQRIRIARFGTDGDVDQAVHVLKKYDGKVDAFGIGGTDIYLGSKERRFPMRDGKRMADAVQKTPVVDGSGLKHSHEKRVIERLTHHPEIKIRGERVLMPCAMDRYGMAEGIVGVGGITTFADLLFALPGVPPSMVQHKLEDLLALAEKVWPDLSKKSSGFLYPTGKYQDDPPRNHPAIHALYDEASVIAGDWYLIRKYLPPSLNGKTVITNTLREDGIDMLRQRGVRWLVTTTPDMGYGVSFGTNVLEAIIVALLDKKPEELTDNDYLNAIDEFGIEPRIQRLT